jgi:hypothetical protein
MQDARIEPTRWLLAILIGLLAMSLSIASAGHTMNVAAVADLEFEEENGDGEDELVETMGIRIELAGGLRVVVTNEAASQVGDVHVPSFAAETLARTALDDYDLHAAIQDIGVVQAYPGGVTFVLEETHDQKAMATLMAHLRAIGAQIDVFEASGRAFGFTAEGVTYRAVFNADPNGTLVYLGH